MQWLPRIWRWYAWPSNLLRMKFLLGTNVWSADNYRQNGIKKAKQAPAAVWWRELRKWKRKKKQRTFKLRNVNFDHHETPSNVLIIPAHGRVSNVAVIACREWWLEPCHPHYVRQGLWCEWSAVAEFRKLSRIGSRRSAQLFMHLAIIFWRSCRAITFRLQNKGCESNGDEVT